MSNKTKFFLVVFAILTLLVCTLAVISVVNNNAKTVNFDKTNEQLNNEEQNNNQTNDEGLNDNNSIQDSQDENSIDDEDSQYEMPKVVGSQTINKKTEFETLNKINAYQQRYFAVVERNIENARNLDYDESENNTKDTITSIFKEVESKIDKKSEYYKKIQEIDEKYKENPGETTADMADFASEECDAFDKLLNEVYQKVKSQLTQEEFSELKKTELAWIKDTRKYCDVYFDTLKFGTMGILEGISEATSSRKFRILLLMMYL